MFPPKHLSYLRVAVGVQKRRGTIPQIAAASLAAPPAPVTTHPVRVRSKILRNHLVISMQITSRSTVPEGQLAALPVRLAFNSWQYVEMSVIQHADQRRDF